MVWYNLRIGSHIAKVKPLTLRMPKLNDVDENGKDVKKIQIAKSEYKWIRVSDNKEVSKVYKSLNGKVLRKMTKTTEINKYEKIKKTKAMDLNIEKIYYVFCETLFSELKDTEAIQFYYSNGNGFKIYVAVIYKEKNYLVMKCGLGWISEMIKKIDVKSTSEKEEDEAVDRASVDDMLAVVET